MVIGECIEYIPLLESMEEICRMTVDSGPCANYEDMFYYDSFSGKCHPFIYGGCGGNLNKYRTREECEARCSRFGADRNGEIHFVVFVIIEVYRLHFMVVRYVP